MDCPQCRRADGVQSVQSIVRSRSSGVAQALNPPPFPERPQLSMDEAVTRIFLTFILCAVGTTLLGILWGVNRESTVTLFTRTGALVIATIALTIWVAVKQVDSVRMERERFESLSRRWHMATNRWRSMLYCARCHGLFVEGDGSLTQIEQMHARLYS